MPKIQLFAVTKSEFTKFLSNLCRLILCLMLRRAKCCLIRGEGEVFRGEARMARGKPWTEEENELLLKMFGEGKSPQEIYDIGAFPESP